LWFSIELRLFSATSIFHLEIVFCKQNEKIRTTIFLSFLPVGIQPARQRTETFFLCEEISLCFFVQFEGQGAYVFNKVSMISGIGVNWVINYKYYIGVRYNLLSTPVNVIKLLPLIDKSGKVGASHQSASLNFGYIAFAKKRFSVNPEISVGWADCKFVQPADGLRKSKCRKTL
jgi:hypothetical protein